MNRKDLFPFMSILLLLPIINCVYSVPLEMYQLSEQKPWVGSTKSIGNYSSGCLIGGIALPISGPGYQLMKLSTGRFWGHPNLINFLLNLSKKVKNELNHTILIGDLGTAKGGPTLSGHKSHQTGLDVDIWIKTLKIKKDLTLEQLETMQSQSVLDDKKTKIDPNKWGDDQRKILKIISQDSQVQRIFIHPLLKKQLCDEPQHYGFSNAELIKIRPWWGHDDHFHVRLYCPEDSTQCVHQVSPQDTACDETLDWWFTDEAKPKEIRLDHLARFMEARKHLPDRCKIIF